MPFTPETETFLPAPFTSSEPLILARLAASTATLPAVAVTASLILASAAALIRISPFVESTGPETTASFAASSFTLPPDWISPVIDGLITLPCASFSSSWVAPASRLDSLTAVKLPAVSIRPSFMVELAPNSPFIPLTYPSLAFRFTRVPLFRMRIGFSSLPTMPSFSSVFSSRTLPAFRYASVYLGLVVMSNPGLDSREIKFLAKREPTRSRSVPVMFLI